MSETRFNIILDDPAAEPWRGIVEKTNFKQVLKFFRTIDADELTDAEKFQYMLKQFFNTVPDLAPADIVDAVIEFISCGKSTRDENGDNTSTSAKAKKIFCWNQDAGRIFAAFWQVYKIDLRTAELHWFAFHDLFHNMPDTTRLSQIIDLRSRKPRKDASTEEKTALREAQEAVALEDDEDNDGGDSLDEFFNAISRRR